MQFVQPILENGKSQFSIPESNDRIAIDKWKNSLIVYILGSRPLYKQFIDNVSRIIKDGPYTLNSKIIIIKQWKPGMKFTRNYFSSIPILIELHDLSLETWNKDAISRIASTLGETIRMDSTTARRPDLIT